MNAFAFWLGDKYMDGYARYLTPTECERLQGLPEGWTEFGADDEKIADTVRYRALGNAIALPCAEYIMSGIKEALSG